MCYGILRAILTVILKLLFHLKVEGLENLPKKTNFILVANHTSFLDSIIMAVAIPEKIEWIALSSFYNVFWLRWLMQLNAAIPTGSASTKAIYLLMQNKNLGLFPEGTRSYDGMIKEFKTGAALLAIKTGRPVVPCAILGAYEAFPRQANFPKFLPLKLKIGRPIYLLKEHAEWIDEIYLQEGTLKIRNTIQEMLYAK